MAEAPIFLATDRAPAGTAALDFGWGFDEQGATHLVAGPPARRLGRAEWLDMLVQALLLDRERPLLLYTHGATNTVRGAWLQALRLRRLYGVTVVIFAWPQRPGVELRAGYRRTLRGGPRAARDCAALFAMVVERLAAPGALPGPGSRHRALVFQSLGQMLLVQGLDAGLYPPGMISFFDSVLLPAGDVPAEGHGAWVEALRPAGGVAIAFNEVDPVLHLSARWSRAIPEAAELGMRGARLGRDPGRRVPWVSYLDAGAQMSPLDARRPNPGHRYVWRPRGGVAELLRPWVSGR